MAPLAWRVIAIVLTTAWGGCLAVESDREEVKPSCDFTDQDVKFFDVKLTTTKVPKNMTTYACQAKRIPLPSLDESYHAIGFLPLVGNKDVVHHMILFGCPETPSAEDVHYCGDNDFSCRHFMVQWSRGVGGAICDHPDAGVKFGRNSVKWLSLQIHWNNQLQAEDLKDNSGFRVFYTSSLRKYDMSNVQIGQNFLEIPPLQPNVRQSGSCSSDCTRTWLKHPIYLTRAHIHMHYTGVGGSIQVIRPNGSLVEVVNDDTYDYNKPPVHTFRTPVQVNPGDEVKVTCVFNTKDGERKRNETLNFGVGSDGEMCYAFVTYYPMVDHFDQCIQVDQFDICTRDGFAPLGECIFPGFVRVFEGMARDVMNQCKNSSGHTNTQEQETGDILCAGQCQQAISEVTDHPCMQGNLRQEAEMRYLPQVALWTKVKAILETANQTCTSII